jgi:hypothetical protein
MASAALVVAGVMSTGGLSALAAKIFHSTDSANKTGSKEPKEKEK